MGQSYPLNVMMSSEVMTTSLDNKLVLLRHPIKRQR